MGNVLWLGTFWKNPKEEISHIQRYKLGDVGAVEKLGFLQLSYAASACPPTK